MTHILLVEDNPTIGSNTKHYLESEHFTVERKIDGMDAREDLQTKTYDLIVLDVMLPGMDGMSLCKKIRTQRGTPIIMMTAKGELEDKGDAFEAGADDYLVKPCALQELVMRIKALLKRSDIADIVRVKDVEIAREDNHVTRAGKSVHLTTKEFLILSYLVDKMPHVVPRSDIIEFVR